MAKGERELTMKNKLELVPTNSTYSQVCRDALNGFTPKERGSVRIADVPTTAHSVVVARILDIPTGLEGQHLIFTGGVEAALVGLRMAEWKKKPSRLHIVAHESEPSQATIERLVSGYLAPDSTPIIDAAWVGDDFLVVSHTLEPLRIKRDKLTRWLGSDKKKHAKFQIDSDGSYVLWPHADAHFGWKQLQYLVDPTARMAAEQRSAKYRVRYGNAIRQVREAHGLRQSDLGLNDRHVRRIEQGTQFPTAKALRTIAASHEMPIEDYLEEVAKAL
jgi:hypothetical protein